MTDAVVVGLGAAGAVVAEQLTRAGMQVVGLDKGPEQTADDVRFKHDELRYFARAQISPHMATDPLTWRPDQRTPARVLPWNMGPDALGPLFLPPSIGTGGGSVHWACWAWRQRESDFRMRSTIVERFGERAVPEGTTLVDWPISYADLEPYYDRVEWEQGVSGEAGANPFEPPRSRGYPMPPLRRAAADERFVRAAKELGMHPFPVPVGIASQDYGENRSACTYCGFCRDFPCHVNAKTSTHVTSIPRALATGNLDLRPFCRVVSVERGADGRASGVRYLDALGAEHEERAPLVVLACYALENARLLLASGIDGNGQVGRNYMTHNYGWFTGLLEEWTNPFMGPAVASSAFDDLTSERVPDNDLGVLWGSPIMGFTGDVQPIETTNNMPPDIPSWGQGFKDWLRDNYRRQFSMYTQTPTFPSERYFCDLDPTAKDPWGQPALRITHDWEPHDKAGVELLAHTKRDIAREMAMTTFWEAPVDPPYHVSTHELGTHRMGDDPAASVVDRFGEVHTCLGLYAIGGGQFPTLGAYNPTETIMALAYFSADHILAAAGGR
jgi:gluconate 2-dehydrogenase alpha chain